jgi:hypothetical protein
MACIQEDVRRVGKKVVCETWTRLEKWHLCVVKLLSLNKNRKPPFGEVYSLNDLGGACLKERAMAGRSTNEMHQQRASCAHHTRTVALLAHCAWIRRGIARVLYELESVV